MKVTRRETFLMGSAALAVTILPIRAMASTEEAIAEFTGGAEIGEGGITLTTPEIAENGNTVPIEVEAEGAEEIRIFADGNPLPGVAHFMFGPLAASHMAATRIRLARTQDLIAVARMSDGSFVQDRKTVKVTIGGCGG